MLEKLLKSLPIVAGTVSATVILGIICFGRSLDAVFPGKFSMLFYPGLIISLAGLVLSIASSLFILRRFVFFTHTQVVDEGGNVLHDNRPVTIGSEKMPPFLVAACGVLFSMILIGVGFGMMFDNVTMYIISLLSFALILLLIALVIFLFSVIRHKIRRRFAWTASGILGIIALLVILSTIPAVSDLSVKDSELSAITATVVTTSSHSGFLTGPGKSVIRIKGTSGEIIKLRYSGNRGAFKVGKKYTFYYLPHTHLIKKVSPAGSIQY